MRCTCNSDECAICTGWQTFGLLPRWLWLQRLFLRLALFWRGRGEKAWQKDWTE